MSKIAGKITIATLTGEVLSYIIDFSWPGYVLKEFIKKDTNIDIKEQKLVFKGVKTKCRIKQINK